MPLFPCLFSMFLSCSMNLVMSVVSLMSRFISNHISDVILFLLSIHGWDRYLYTSLCGWGLIQETTYIPVHAIKLRYFIVHKKPQIWICSRNKHIVLSFLAPQNTCVWSIIHFSPPRRCRDIQEDIQALYSRYWLSAYSFPWFIYKGEGIWFYMAPN